MNFIDSLTTTIDQLTRLIHRLEHFIADILNLSVDEMHNAIDTIQNQIADLRQDGIAIMSTLDPVSLRHTAGYWTRSGLRRRWISYRGRLKRGGRWHRGWGQRRYAWRPTHYQQEHNYSRQAPNDAISINMRRGNLLMMMPSTQEAIMDILPLVQPVTWPATRELSAPLFSDPSEAQRLVSEASRAQQPLSEPFTPQPVFARPARAQLQSLWPQSRVAQPPQRLSSRRSRAQPLSARYSMGRPVLAQPNRPPRRLARSLYRAQPVRVHGQRPSAMGEGNRFVPGPVQSARDRAISTNSRSRTAGPAAEHNTSVPDAQIVPEQIVPSPVVPESEQVVLSPVVPESEQVVLSPVVSEPEQVVLSPIVPEPEQVVPVPKAESANDTISFNSD